MANYLVKIKILCNISSKPKQREKFSVQKYTYKSAKNRKSVNH